MNTKDSLPRIRTLSVSQTLLRGNAAWHLSVWHVDTQVITNVPLTPHPGCSAVLAALDVCFTSDELATAEAEGGGICVHV